jgi:carotenoid 1,2-hydratase
VSDDGRHAIVVIALLGSPFSPHYASARRRGPTNPLDHCALHVALYGPGATLWTLVERSLELRDLRAHEATLGASAIVHDEDSLRIGIDERAPFGDAIRGRVRWVPDLVTEARFTLDDAARHRWWPVAPSGTLEVELSTPRLRFRGRGYHDVNAGDEPLEAAFARWDWSRASGPDGAWVTYDVCERAGALRSLALDVTSSGVASVEDSERVELPRSRWGLVRTTRAEKGGGRVELRRSLEDGPFYARSRLGTRWRGRELEAMHETLDVRRLASSWGRFFARFRTRRAG